MSLRYCFCSSNTSLKYYNSVSLYQHIINQFMTFLLTGIQSAPTKLMASACSSTTSTDSVVMEPLIIPSLLRSFCKRGSVSPSCWSLYKMTLREFGQSFLFRYPSRITNDCFTHAVLRRRAVDILRFWRTERGQDHQERLQQNWKAHKTFAAQ